ncbi:MAG: hypothetical protein FWF07_02680 [Methanomassiliicoccaceae archaeon]|nr:hypothetical protein [Methanomassiliicoccaceae archaeon]
MSFFDNNKTIGLVLIIIGLIILVAGIGLAWTGWNDDSVNNTAAACYGIAKIIFGLLIFVWGFAARSGPNDQAKVLSGTIRIVGIATILQAFFAALGTYFANDSSITAGAGTAIGGMIVAIIVGLFLIWVAGKVGGASKNIISKGLWIVLIIVFLYLAISSFFALFSQNYDFSNLNAIVTVIAAICLFILYLYFLVAMFSKDVKSAMGI